MIEVPELEEFYAYAMISEVVQRLKSGKEATAYLCKGGSKLGLAYAVAKVYKDIGQRSFKNDSAYQIGRTIVDKRIERAVKNRSKAGREAQSYFWVSSEFSVLERLGIAGADVPKLFGQSGPAILMEYIGDQQAPALQLAEVKLERVHARKIFDRLMYNVELALSNNCIHGDLSPYNVLYWKSQAVVIDFPQAVDPRFNPLARSLLERDIGNLLRYFRQFGVDEDAGAIARRMWRRFKMAES